MGWAVPSTAASPRHGPRPPDALTTAHFPLLGRDASWLAPFVQDKSGEEAFDALLRGERPPRGQSNVKHHTEGASRTSAVRARGRASGGARGGPARRHGDPWAQVVWTLRPCA